MAQSLQKQKVVVLSAWKSEDEARLNALLKLGWLVKKVEPFSGAGGGASTGNAAFAIVILEWVHDAPPADG